MKKSTVKFDLEPNPEYRFQAIYEGLTLVMQREAQNTDPSKFSIVGAEAYCMLEDLKLSHPQQFQEAKSCSLY